MFEIEIACSDNVKFTVSYITVGLTIVLENLILISLQIYLILIILSKAPRQRFECSDFILNQVKSYIIQTFQREHNFKIIVFTTLVLI